MSSAHYAAVQIPRGVSIAPLRVFDKSGQQALMCYNCNIIFYVILQITVVIVLIVLFMGVRLYNNESVSLEGL